MRRPPKSNRSARPFVIAGGAVVVAAAALVAFTLRGGDDEPPVIPDPTPAAGAFGRAPSLDGNVIAIYPAHAATVTQAETKTGTRENPGAVCFRMKFGDTNGTWYRVAVDGVEVTERMIWIGINPATSELPEEAQLCFDPADGLRTGIIDASIAVQEPNGISPVKEIVEWRFRVDP